MAPWLRLASNVPHILVTTSARRRRVARKDEDPEELADMVAGLDEGSITDSQGRKVDFKYYPRYKQPWQRHPRPPTACTEEVLKRTSSYFPPEFLNRLDTMLVFNTPLRESILQVVDLWLKDVAERLKGHRIVMGVDDTACNLLAKQGQKVESDLAAKRDEASRLTAIWQEERTRLDRIKDLKGRLEEAKHQVEVAQRQGHFELATRADKNSETLQSESSMLRERVTSDDISRVVAKATGIPVQNLLKGERDKLVHVKLRQQVVGQDHVIAAVSDAVCISRAGLQAPNRPVASFLFLGPTGVGKTELCKALAGFLFNDEQRGLININMSEYRGHHTISRLIGAAPGYVGFEEGGQLTEAVRRKPYAVILLDELEKAHKDVAMILLQILDEGSITDSQGRKVDFKYYPPYKQPCDILAHRLPVPKMVTPEARDEVLERTSSYFPPELLNRLDTTLVFNKLSRESILQVVDLRLKDVAERLKGRRIVMDVDDTARNLLAKQGYSQVYGARAIARVVRTDLLFPLAQKLLKGTIRDGDVVVIREAKTEHRLISKTIIQVDVLEAAWRPMRLRVCVK
ncbi:hypothetical protein BDZ89DRAFT_1202694 [Hymenopellis radicata]|nr:hypothetical protein BDZ89DRAFT_1202694 [Hymenopellis radicata]